jgi:pilus assembly protein Flp/PilA
VIRRPRGAWFARSLRDERGASLVEYLLLVALIAMVVMAAVVYLGGQVGSSYDHTTTELSNNL